MEITILGSSHHAQDVQESFFPSSHVSMVDDTQGTLATVTGPVVWGIGSPTLRQTIYQRIQHNPGLTFVSCGTASASARIGTGSVLMPGCQVGHHVVIGAHCLIGAGAILSHDVHLGDFVTISPGAILLGNVHVATGVQVGAGAVLRESIHVHHTVGMGSVVLRDVHRVQWGQPSAFISWCWHKPNDWHLMAEWLDVSARTNQFTNGGPLVHRLAQESRSQLGLAPFHVVPCANGTAALHALISTYRLAGTLFTPHSILASAFGFASMIQGPLETLVQLVDMDPEHGGPILSVETAPPQAILLVNPFGYTVDVAYYRTYCDTHGILLFMDNASTPYTLVTNAQGLDVPVGHLADASIVSLHETKPLGKGEGGLLCVRAELAPYAEKAINFGFDATDKVAHPAASNWRMSDISAAAILMHWKLNWGTLVKYNLDQDHRVVDVPPFRRGRRAIMSALLETRRPRPNMDVRYYYLPLLSADQAPHAWHFFEHHQALPFHPEHPGLTTG